MIIKKIIKGLSYVIFISIFIEIMFRFLGFKPLQEFEVYEISEPTNYGVYDSILGFEAIPGKFKVMIKEKLAFHVTHNISRNRITSKIDTTEYSDKYTINMYGCSFTWGAGVDDEATFPYLLQNKYIDYKINNKALFAGSTLQSYLQLKDAILINNKPEMAIICYASFHNQRNVLTQSWCNMITKASFNNAKANQLDFDEISHEKIWNTYKFPYATSKDGNLYIKYKNIYCQELLGSNNLSICNLLNSIILNVKDSKAKEIIHSKLLIHEIIKLCQSNDIKLAFAFITNDKITKNIASILKQSQIPYTHLNIDYNNPAYNLMPYDAHPNDKAHQMYADSIFNFINTINR